MDAKPTPFTPIAKKLATMVRLLASPNDGEALGAARGIIRTLRSIKLDEHALADAVEALAEKQYTTEATLEIYKAGIEKGKQEAQVAQPARSNGGFHSVGIDPSDWLPMAQECQAHRRKRSTQEEQFVEDMIERAENGRTLTPAQEKWLKDIYGRKPI